MLKFFKKAVIWTVALVGIFVLYNMATMTPEEKAEIEARRKAEVIKAASSLPAPPERSPLERVKLEKMDCSLGGFGVVALCDFTVGNGNEYAVADPVIECTFAGASGTILSAASQTVFEIIPPSQSKRFRKVNMGLVSAQVKSSRCKVISVMRR